MDRFERKLRFFDVPFYKVRDKKEIITTMLSLISDDIDTENVVIHKLSDSDDPFPNKGEIDSIYVVDVVVGVEESALLLLDGSALDLINNCCFCDYFSLVLKREDIVENMELAICKVNGLPDNKRSYIDVLKPSDIPAGCYVFLL